MRSEASAQAKMPITVVILARNEEDTIAEAINSAIDDFYEVIVIDSYSTDQTVHIATSCGARVLEKAFEGFASQRNFALKEIALATEWVFFLDADERITQELVAELRGVFPRESGRVGMFYVRRMDFFEGRWIKRSSGYPTWFGRICNKYAVRVEREINEEYHCSRPTHRLEQHLTHYPFAKGLSHWVSRHNRYSTAEAENKVNMDLVRDGLQLGDLVSGDPALRRICHKKLYMRFPFRPLIAFLYLYFIRGGVLDGRPGLRYALLRAFYELMISIKLDELGKSRPLDK